MATPRLGLVVEDKPTELSCTDYVIVSVIRKFLATIIIVLA